jgi:farnesyl-diphosphate farnesyltransferase
MSLDHLFQIDEGKRDVLFENAVKFGKSLQLINILRDLPEDLLMGRCYIPQDTLKEYQLTAEDLLNSKNIDKFKPLFDLYLERAETYLDNAIEWIEMLPKNQYRLRLSCMLPILIGQRTLVLLKEGNILDANSRIKVLRPEIKKIMRKSIWLCVSRKNPKKMS